MGFADAAQRGSVPGAGGPASPGKRHGCEDRTQVKISVDRDVAAAFKAACAASDASMAIRHVPVHDGLCRSCPGEAESAC